LPIGLTITVQGHYERIVCHKCLHFLLMIFEAELRTTMVVMFSPICECDGACKQPHWNTVERRQHYDPHGWRHIIIVRENDSQPPAGWGQVYCQSVTRTDNTRQPITPEELRQ